MKQFVCCASRIGELHGLIRFSLIQRVRHSLIRSFHIESVRYYPKYANRKRFSRKTYRSFSTPLHTQFMRCPRCVFSASVLPRAYNIRPTNVFITFVGHRCNCTRGPDIYLHTNYTSHSSCFAFSPRSAI